jgi:hypothetical protein
MAQSTILLLPSGDKKQRCATLEMVLPIKTNHVKQPLRFNNNEKEQILHYQRHDKDAESRQGEL